MSRGHFFLRLDDVIFLFLFYISELLCCSAGVFPCTRLIEFFWGGEKQISIIMIPKGEEEDVDDYKTCDDCN